MVQLTAVDAQKLCWFKAVAASSSFTTISMD